MLFRSSPTKYSAEFTEYLPPANDKEIAAAEERMLFYYGKDRETHEATVLAILGVAEKNPTLHWKFQLVIASTSFQIMCKNILTVACDRLPALPFARGSASRHASCELVLKWHCVRYSRLTYMTRYLLCVGCN